MEERQLFLKKYSADWNVIRHRIAGPIHDAITDALDCGQLTITPATIESLASGEHGIEIQMVNRDGSSDRIEGDLVINCTGPKSRFSDSALPLYRNLFERGLAQPDEMDMGIAVTDNFTVVGKDDTPTPFMYAIGPILKGTLWESIAVPELRQQAYLVAQSILHQEPVTVSSLDTTEYCI